MAEVKVIVNDKMIVAEAASCGSYFLINMTGDCISLDKEDGETITVPVSGLPKLEIAFEALVRTRTEARTKLVEMITAGPKLKNVPVVIDPSPMYIFLFTKEDAIKVAATKYSMRMCCWLGKAETISIVITTPESVKSKFVDCQEKRKRIYYPLFFYLFILG